MSDSINKEIAQQDTADGRLNDGGAERGRWAEFTASVLQPYNFSEAIALPLSGTPMVLAALTGAQALGLDAGDRVWLAGTIGWRAVTNGKGVTRVDVIFRIFRNTPVTGLQLFSIRESAESAFDNFEATSFDHVDINPAADGNTLVSYFLTAELPLAGSAATVIGPVTFIASELEPGHKPPGCG
ncbi:MAG: hypothetical protein ABSC17_03595 [Thermacetogeniaceae bacterium]